MNDPKKLKLKGDPGPYSKAGYAVCVLDRGAVRFEFPRKWILTQRPDSVQIHDCEPPGDNCVLGVSRFLAPEEAIGVPVAELVAAAVAGDEREVLARNEIVATQRENLELAWVEARYIDAETKREAVSRMAIGRGSGVHCLVTFDFFADQAAHLGPVWNEVLRSLALGRYIQDSA